jgi:AmiR/NasT family two-component response regulator
MPHFHRALPARSVGEGPAVTQSLQVALVVDERDMREYLQEALARLGHQVLARLGHQARLGHRGTIALALLRYQHFQALTMESADLRQALEDRKVIERAKGAFMRRLGVDEAEAFRRLRSLASEQNLKLVEVGRRILAAEEVFSLLDRR